MSNLTEQQLKELEKALEDFDKEVNTITNESIFANLKRLCNS